MQNLASIPPRTSLVKFAAAVGDPAALPRYDDLRREHQKQLKLLKEATSEADLHHFVVLAYLGINARLTIQND